MSFSNFGLMLNFVGSILLGLCSQFGSSAGWGGVLVWKSKYWRCINIIGWSLLSIGFAIQFYSSQ